MGKRSLLGVVLIRRAYWKVHGVHGACNSWHYALWNRTCAIAGVEFSAPRLLLMYTHTVMSRPLRLSCDIHHIRPSSVFSIKLKEQFLPLSSIGMH